MSMILSKVLGQRAAAVATAAVLLTLGACQKTAQYPETLPPLKQTLDCIPKNASIIAAHRGTSRDWSLAENSLSALEKLINKGYLVAEIDVAGLKDRTLITYHDGVWDEASTGKGPVAASRRGDLNNILLKTRKGRFTSERPPLFDDLLKTAKGRIYLEIDFKSSADINNVIDVIDTNNMRDQVLLIAYTGKQARKLRQIAPDILLSVPENSAQRGDLVWLGKDAKNSARTQAIKARGQYVIGKVGRGLDETNLAQTRSQSDILVTDYPNQYMPVTGLNNATRKSFEACLLKAN